MSEIDTNSYTGGDVTPRDRRKNGSGYQNASQVIPTRTRSTVSRYLKAAIRIEMRARRELLRSNPEYVSPDKPLTPMQLATWLVREMQHNKISPSTYRQYKACLRCAFQETPLDESVDAIDYLNAHQNSRGERYLAKRTSARKAKSISMDSLIKLCDHLSAIKNPYAKLASMWLISGYHVGLRPCEWEFAFIHVIDGARYVRARNAKNTNGRAHGEFRDIVIEHLDAYSIDTISDFIHMVQEAAERESFKVVQDKCRMAIYRASRKIFDRRHKSISLYTMRHQFSANAKSTLSLRETGALMGHAVADTSQENYAHRRVGTPVKGLFARMEQVARVKPPTKVYEERMGNRSGVLDVPNVD